MVMCEKKSLFANKSHQLAAPNLRNHRFKICSFSAAVFVASKTDDEIKSFFQSQSAAES